MKDLWKILVYENQQLVYANVVAGAIELGRQADSREEPFSQAEKQADYWRVVVARREDQTVSREHAVVEPLADKRVRVSNKSKKQTIRLLDGGELAPQTSCEHSLPLLMVLGGTTIHLQEPDAEDGPLRSLADAPRRPGASPAPADLSLTLAALAAPAGNEAALEMFLHNMQGVLEVMQSAVSSSDFFARAARAVVELVGLDSGQVLLLHGEEFRQEAAFRPPHLVPDPAWRPSQLVLGQVRQQKRTFWQVPGAQATPESLLGVKAVVAAPILDRQGEVIGTLYGDRHFRAGPSVWEPITRLEAMLVELLAVGVAAGLARLKEEQAALRARVQFEQFFTRELSLQLAAHPDLLQGRDVEITVLFCDIRGFSAVSKDLGPARTVAWVSDVMEVLSECVRAQQGVLVDYIGDELVAMWGAPVEQPEHARLACRAALDMLARLPELNARWLDELGKATDVSIGINTGVARVGNVGTKSKFKYGPLGNTVNLASRVQGATKYLKSRLLITRATWERLDESFLARRLCRVEVVNIPGQVDLVELMPPGQLELLVLKETYERALTEFENRNYRVAARLLAPLVGEEINDGPSLVLISRAINALIAAPAEANLVWELPGK